MERKNEGESPSGSKIVRIKTGKGTRAYITDHGYVLIFSLWAIVIFGFIAVSFTRNTSIAIKTEITFTERVKNIYAARGACIYATQKLLQPKKKETNTKSGKVIKTKKDADTHKMDKSGAVWVPSNNPYSIQIGDRNCEVSISDESGKINVNKITDDTRTTFIKFLTAYKLEELAAETITDSILDWLDKDDLHHMNGAEKDYYATLPEPYEPKNGPFDSIEELTLVKGITPQVFELLRDHLSVYGSGKINVNFAPKEVLLYVPSITHEMAETIIQFRKKRGTIKKLDTLKGIFRHFGIIGNDYQKIMDYLTINDSNYITINSVASSGKIKNSYKFLVLKSVGHCKIIAAYPE
ncbi:MAG: general secretion pathway protein GspK [Candidatus Brocadia sp.]|nr:general secretion pathway protein GspK [Candidatus Brocadia sp.]